MKIIKIKADLWQIAPNWAVAGTRGSFGCCEIEFELSHHWNGMEKRVTFYPAGGEDAVAVILNEGSVRVPDEVMARAGLAIFVLDGIGSDGRVLVSARGELRIIDTASPGGREPKECVPSEIDQLRAEVASLRGEINALKKEAV